MKIRGFRARERAVEKVAQTGGAEAEENDHQGNHRHQHPLQQGIYQDGDEPSSQTGQPVGNRYLLRRIYRLVLPKVHAFIVAEVGGVVKGTAEEA